MNKIILTFLFFCIVKNASGQQIPNGFNDNGSMFRNSKITGTRYVLLDAKKLPQGTSIHKVKLKRSLYTQPQTDLTIEVYNILFDQKNLAVFSVMPSLFSKDPLWKKIDIDTLKTELITVNQLQDTMKARFSKYPDVGKYGLDRLKYFNYTLVLKRTDGYYCSATDCFTEFLQINDSDRPTVFGLNLNRKMLSTAEYESAYLRKHSSYSSNYGNADSQASIGHEESPRLNLSYIIPDNGKKAYKFWLLDNWMQDGISYYRGMDRFIFEPGIGIIGAAYDFFMPALSDYWYHIPDAPSEIIKGSPEDKGFYPITPYFPKSDPTLFNYLTESVINYVSIDKL